VSRDEGFCALEDCERPVAPGKCLCKWCADGAEPSTYRHVKDGLCGCCELQPLAPNDGDLCAGCRNKRIKETPA
jgi:hypothetical protein